MGASWTKEEENEEYDQRNQFDEICRPVYVVSSIEKCRLLTLRLKEFCSGNNNVLGFSWQGVWDFRGHEPVHWLQLSTYPYRSPYYFIRLTKIKEIPLELKEILEDRNIIKVSDISEDVIVHLKRDYGVRVNGVLDLRFMADKAECLPGGLAKMSKDYLNYQLDKHPELSYWEVTDLSDTQIEYALEYASVCIALFRYFANRIDKGKSPKYIIDNYFSEDIDCFYGDRIIEKTFGIQKMKNGHVQYN